MKSLEELRVKHKQHIRSYNEEQMNKHVLRQKFDRREKVGATEATGRTIHRMLLEMNQSSDIKITDPFE